MSSEEYISKRNQLFDDWKKARPDYYDFTSDGPSNWDEWVQQKPKILFLLKEALDSYTPSNPDKTAHKIYKSFGLNIARWKYAIKTSYANPNEIPLFPNDDFLRKWSGNTNADIAIVEVKKNDEGKNRSNKREITKYADCDRVFLKQQIDLIDPQVILCGGTGEEFGDYIYWDDSWDELATEFGYTCHKLKERLIISFCHPSIRSGPLEKFNILCKMINKHRVFEKFDWGPKLTN